MAFHDPQGGQYGQQGELQDRLDELDRELQEGDITTKGYQKRRTQLLSQYLAPGVYPDEPKTVLRVHSPDSSSHPSSDGHRSAALMALNANSSSSDSGAGASGGGGVPAAAGPANNNMNNNSSNNNSNSYSPARGGPYSPPPARIASPPQQPGPYGGMSNRSLSPPVAGGGGPLDHGFQRPVSLLRPGGTMASERPHMVPQRDSLFLAAGGGGSGGGPATGGGESTGRSDTMLSAADYAFNPGQQQGPGANAYGADYAPQHQLQHQQQQGYGQMYDGRSETLLNAQGYFSDFAGQQAWEGSGTMLSSMTGGGGGPQQQEYGGGSLQRYSTSADAAAASFSPTAAMAPPMLSSSDLPPPDVLSSYLMPLEPRELPFAIFDPHDDNVPMARFDNMAAVLRHRGRTNGKTTAYWVLDAKGKETASITWEKLASRAEKVAQVIREKSSLYKGDRVALIYRDSEIIDFAIALMGCFIAGVVAVPINDFQDYYKLNMILTSTQAHLALTTENNLKTFQRDITTQKLNWPKGVEWWKTNDFGPKKKDDGTPLSAPDLAYIEFSRAPTGDLRGVVLSHRTIMHQMGCLSAMFSTAPGGSNGTSSVAPTAGDTFSTSLRDRNGRLINTPSASGNHAAVETLLSYLDPRQGIGLILGVLLNVYGGHTAVWMESRAVEVPGLYAHLITKHRATLMAADYPGLKRAAYNYQQDPMTTRNYKKGMEPNFSAVKLCLIDTLTVDPEFHEVLADRWLRPLRNPAAREVLAPMLCLPEHGGMVITARDWLGGEENMGCALKLDVGDEDESEEEHEEADAAAAKDKEGGTDAAAAAAAAGFVGSLLGGGAGGGNAGSKTGRGSGGGGAGGAASDRAELSEVLLDREYLKNNEVVVVAVGEEARRKAASEPGCVRIGGFGYPIPDATLAIVDPETGLLASPHSVGEIWVDSPSLSGGFWALPKHTEQIFHARPYKFDPGNPTPTSVEPEFLRTGLLGTIIEGKIFVLGLYEDRIRQKVEWVEEGPVGGTTTTVAEDGTIITVPAPPPVTVVEHRYFFVQHMVVSIMRNVPKIYDCSAFDVFVNEEHLPIVVVESQAASTTPATSGGPPRQLDTALLDSLAERCMEVLFQEHHLRVFCVMMTAPNALPRVVKNGRREIGNILCRREFDLGNLACVHVKFGVEHAVLNLPLGVDPMGGIWSGLASRSRADILLGAEKQYSGIDRREVVMDDRTSTPLNNFSSITDLIQWRVARQPEELAYCTIDGRGKEGKGVTWKKLDMRIAAVAIYLKNKVKIRPGDHVILMYTHSEEFIFAVHACINLGAVAIPMQPMDENRLNEDVPAYLHLVADYGVRAVLVNVDVDHLLKQKNVAQHVKQSASVLKVALPSVYNTAKPPKQTSGLRDLGLTMEPAWVQPGYPVVIWTYWTPDQRRIAVKLSHDTVLGMCKVQKETCQMTSSRPVLGCVRSHSGLGFIHSVLMGVYIGTPTYLLSPVEFAQNPMSLFLTISRYKIKDTYATPQMLDHAMASMPGKGFTLHELKNMMISADGRPRVDVFQKVRHHFAAAGLDRTAINTVYSHVLNPMVASRSYMCIEPIELWLDTRALRRGLVVPSDPDRDPRALLVQDSGMVPVSTQIGIVNPESRLLCRDGEYGEIWVDSEACVGAFYGSKDAFDAERFDGRTLDGDPSIRYVRTGDLGFLHSVSRPIGPGGAQVDMQVLFVLGSIGETFEINGLCHFPMDIEYSVERCHRNVVPGGCAVFQAGGLIVVLVEVARKAYLASVVPVIVNSILNEHQIVVDIVAFVNKGDFPRSRLGEKQRGKILAGWVTRKMRTMAQFAIRDMDPAAMAAVMGPGGAAAAAAASLLGPGGAGMDTPPAGGTMLTNVSSNNNIGGLDGVAEPRVSTSSSGFGGGGSTMAGGLARTPTNASMRTATNAGDYGDHYHHQQYPAHNVNNNNSQEQQILEQRDLELQMERLSTLPPPPPGVTEMSAAEDSTVRRPSYADGATMAEADGSGGGGYYGGGRQPQRAVPDVKVTGGSPTAGEGNGTMAGSGRGEHENNNNNSDDLRTPTRASANAARLSLISPAHGFDMPDFGALSDEPEPPSATLMGPPRRAPAQVPILPPSSSAPQHPPPNAPLPPPPPPKVLQGPTAMRAPGGGGGGGYAQQVPYMLQGDAPLLGGSLATLPSQQQQGGVGRHSQAGQGWRPPQQQGAAQRKPQQPTVEDDEDEWRNNAMLGLSLAER